MARLMPEGADLIVPVPLHRWRIWRRGFNQAALMAQSLSKASGVAVDLTVLTRPKATPPLRGLGAVGRAKAVAGAFHIQAPERVKGRAILLIDDVYTSGATADGCIRVLLRAGAKSVTILCWARVLGDDNHLPGTSD